MRLFWHIEGQLTIFRFKFLLSPLMHQVFLNKKEKFKVKSLSGHSIKFPPPTTQENLSRNTSKVALNLPKASLPFAVLQFLWLLQSGQVILGLSLRKYFGIILSQ